tara:strand:+ start:1682 stop:1954 length:273 start_codon:yes stop_codon:yes gene_type:complete
MSEDEEKQKEVFRAEVINALMESNDVSIIVLGNYAKDESVSLELGLNVNNEELFYIFSELFKDKEIRDEARKAVLYSDYGNKNADSLNLN